MLDKIAVSNIGRFWEKNGVGGDLVVLEFFLSLKKGTINFTSVRMNLFLTFQDNWVDTSTLEKKINAHPCPSTDNYYKIQNF